MPNPATTIESLDVRPNNRFPIQGNCGAFVQTSVREPLVAIQENEHVTT